MCGLVNVCVYVCMCVTRVCVFVGECECVFCGGGGESHVCDLGMFGCVCERGCVSM